jgi:hypothetical protein
LIVSGDNLQIWELQLSKPATRLIVSEDNLPTLQLLEFRCAGHFCFHNKADRDNTHLEKASHPFVVFAIFVKITNSRVNTIIGSSQCL